MSSTLRRELEAELKELRDQEAAAEADLDQSFEDVMGSRGKVSGNSGGMRFNSVFDMSGVENSLRKIEGFSPYYEAMLEDSRKLAVQVEDCRALSDRVNVIVRRLDNMQIRSQKALACTEDIINLKESKSILQAAIDEKNLHAAVRCLQMVHHIDKQAADASEDYKEIMKLEGSVKDLVQADFDDAINKNELNDVMSLCPLLQTLGLETTARDRFLEFVTANVFIAVSADGASVGASTDPASGYAQALSGVFNSAYLILQKYLPLVIQGMENSLGDIHFVSKLHARAEKQAGLVLKRYMKYRNCKEVITSVKAAGVDGELAPVAIGGGGGANNQAGDVVSVGSAAGLHEMLDEIALLIQYCCLYSRYLWQLCEGARKRDRPAFNAAGAGATAADNAASSTQESSSNNRNRTSSSSSSSSRRARSRTLSRGDGGDDEHDDSGAGTAPSSSASNGAGAAVAEVFPGPLTFDKIVDELINSYYMEAERWIMHQSLRKMVQAQQRQQQRRLETASENFASAAELSSPFNDGLDEAFFVFQRCGQRAIATNNIHAACAVLHLVGDLVSSELLTHVSDGMSQTTRTVTEAMYAKAGSMVDINSSSSSGSSSAGKRGGDGNNNDGGSGNNDDDEYVLDKTIMQGYKNALQLASSMQQGGGHGQQQQLAGHDISGQGYSQRIQSRLGRQLFDEEEDPYGVSEWLQVYNTAERCARYSDRLGGDVLQSGDAVFPDDTDKIKLCREGFSAACQAFRTALAGELEALSRGAGKVLKEVLFGVFGSHGPLGGIRFDLIDEQFESQQSLSVVPTALTRTVEVLVDMCCQSLSEVNRTTMLGLLAEQCGERLEHFISQHSFHFYGALKMEECVRSIIAVFNQKAGPGISLRSKFSRIREVMLVLTSDDTSGTFSDSLGQLTYSEAESLLALRLPVQ
jgi:hypothetical protein